MQELLALPALLHQQLALLALFIKDKLADRTAGSGL
jgi:hypothetical protein